MDDKEKQLYEEENLQTNKEVLKQLKSSIIYPIPTIKMPKEIEARIINKVVAELSDPVELDDAPFVQLGEDLQATVKLLVESIVKAVSDNAPKEEVTVKNIGDAKTEAVTVKNLAKVEQLITNLTKAVIDSKPVVNVQKQEISWPRSASEAIAVRLSDGKSFYTAIANAVSSGGGGASFKNSSGVGAQVQLTSDGKVPVEASISLATSDIQIGAIEIKDHDSDTRVDVTAGNALKVDNSAVTQPISAASLPLPTSAATSAKQDTGNTSLASLDTKLPAQGQALAAASVPVVLPAAQVTTLTPPAAITGYATSAIQTDKTQFTKLTDGTDTMLVTAAGEANVLESNSAAIKTAVETIDNMVSGSGANISQINGVTPLMGAGNTGTGSPRVTIASDQATIPVSLASVPSHAVTNVGTFAVQAASAGDIAHDAADSGNPVKIGLKANSSLATTTLVANNDRTDSYADLDGTQLTRLDHPLGDLKTDAISNTDGASTASAVFTAVASTKNYIKAIHVFRTDAGTTPIYIDFRDGAAGAVLWRMVIPPNGGSIAAPSGALFRTSANTALAYDVSAATTTVYVNVSGFQSKV